MNLYRYTNIGANIYLNQFKVLRKTPKGFWIRDVFHNNRPDHPRRHERWVSDYSKKRFAYPTKKQAWGSFIKRKQRHLAILRAKVRDIETLLEWSHPEKIPIHGKSHSRTYTFSSRHGRLATNVASTFYDMTEPLYTGDFFKYRP